MKKLLLSLFVVSVLGLIFAPKFNPGTERTLLIIVLCAAFLLLIQSLAELRRAAEIITSLLYNRGDGLPIQLRVYACKEEESQEPPQGPVAEDPVRTQQADCTEPPKP